MRGYWISGLALPLSLAASHPACGVPDTLLSRTLRSCLCPTGVRPGDLWFRHHLLGQLSKVTSLVSGTGVDQGWLGTAPPPPFAPWGSGRRSNINGCVSILFNPPISLVLCMAIASSSMYWLSDGSPSSKSNLHLESTRGEEGGCKWDKKEVKRVKSVHSACRAPLTEESVGRVRKKAKSAYFFSAELA